MGIIHSPRATTYVPSFFFKWVKCCLASNTWSTGSLTQLTLLEGLWVGIGPCLLYMATTVIHFPVLFDVDFYTLLTIFDQCFILCNPTPCVLRH